MNTVDCPNPIFTKPFWVDAAERAIKTVAQSALVAIGTDSLDIISADWTGIASVGLGGGVLSLLTSVATAQRTGSPSAVGLDPR